MIFNISKIQNENCCGCSACEAICPTGAIRMTTNEKGFYAPSVDEDKCIKCKRCLSVCHANTKQASLKSPEKLFGAYCPSYEEQKASSSGGVFSAICNRLKELNNDDFYCYGAVFDNMRVVHYGTGNAEEFGRFCGSKYVQSDMSGIYRDVFGKLSNGKTVLFSGTGCQCGGLRSYLSAKNADDSRLFVIDIICHGVPSPIMWSDYLSALEKQNNQKIIDYRFRNKDISWHGIRPTVKTESGEPIACDELLNSYGKLFGRLSLNDICHSCRYASTQRCGDLTLGDYWNVDRKAHSIDERLGVSECLANTEKGLYLVDIIRDKMVVFDINDDSYLQPQLVAPTKKSILHNAFWKSYKKKGYVATAIKYTKSGFLRSAYVLLRRMMSRGK